MFCGDTGDITEQERVDRLFLTGHIQKNLSHKLDRLQRDELFENSSLADQIRLNSLLSQRTSAWLQAIPSRGPIDLVLSADQTQVALMQRLGIPLAQNGDICPVCDGHRLLDHLGHHHVTCSTGGFVVVRHNRVRDSLLKLCMLAGLSPQKEQGCSFGDKSRPFLTGRLVRVQPWTSLLSHR